MLEVLVPFTTYLQSNFHVYATRDTILKGKMFVYVLDTASENIQVMAVKMHLRGH